MNGTKKEWHLMFPTDFRLDHRIVWGSGHGGSYHGKDKKASDSRSKTINGL